VLFGATDQILPYALEYGYIYIISVPFVIVAIGMNSMIRADGSPKYAMYSMITGALINVVLDAIFVLGLNWGMTGAALATTIGQIIATCISLYYIRKFRHVDVNRQTMKMNVGVSRTLLSYGISSFISQMAVTVVILVINNALVQYGAMSEYGAEIPLTAVGIVMKVNQIITYIIIGIGIGSQPIIGYNYGAKQYQRVKQTMKYAIFAVLATTIIALAAFQIFPQYIVMLFGNENELYTTFAIMTFRISLAGIIFNGLTVVFGIFLQSLGKPLKATIVSLSRQILLLIPAVLILSMLFGVEGILWSIPLADTIAAVISSLLMYLEIRKLNHEEEVEVEHLHELGLDEELNVIHEE
jgi:putative MATE family efflux protein